MIQITPQMRILVAVEPADFRKGIDGLARLCKKALKRDPFGGGVFVLATVLWETDRHSPAHLAECSQYYQERNAASYRSRRRQGRRKRKT